MKKKIPIGISDFKILCDEGYYYVDKSLLIKELSGKGRVVLMPRPRRFGKTLNLSMLCYFYEKAGQSTAYLFEPLSIWQESGYKEQQGQYPVISVSFKSIFQSNYGALLKKFAYTIAKEFARHKVLLTSGHLEDHEKERFNRLRTETASELDLGSSLEFLSEMLYKHYNKQVIVLVDEYDVPVQAAYIHGFYDELIIFLKELLTGALKDQNKVKKGVLTGIMTLAKAGIFSGLNNLDIYNLTNPKLADKFGFTSAEAEALLAYYECADQTPIKEWYDGYIFGKTEGMFNPWSLLKCVQNKGALEIYWANTSDNVLLKRLIARSSSATKAELENLLIGKSVDKMVEESVVYPEIDQHQELIWSVLLFTGYLTYTDYELKEGKKLCSLVIPNEEIRFLYRDLIRKLFNESVTGGHAQDLLQALIEGDTEIFSQLLQNFIHTSMSAYDLSSTEPESSYHLFILGLLVLLSSSYEVRSNRESGLGRYDIMIIPKQKNGTGIIIEFKKVWKKGDVALEETAHKALEQIIEKKYAQELADQGVKKMRAYGIAFEGKNVYVASRSL